MSVLRSLVIGLFLLCSGSLALAAEGNSYAALVTQLKSGNTAIDFQALRYARAGLPGYNPYEALADPAKGDMFRAIMAGNLDRVLTLANQILARDYTDIEAHAALAAVFERRGMSEEATRERAIGDGLLRSIQDSGDGMTPETAYVVVGVAEEYSLIGASGVQVVRQSLLQTPRGPVDAIETVHPQTGERRIVYFDVSRLFNAMSRLGGAQKSP